MSSARESVESFPAPPPPLENPATGEREPEHVRYSHHDNNNPPADVDDVMMDDDGDHNADTLPMQVMNKEKSESEASLCMNGSTLSTPDHDEDTITQMTTLTSRESKELRVRFKEDDADEIIGYSNHDETSTVGSAGNTRAKRGASPQFVGESATEKVKRALICYTPDPEEETIYLKAHNKTKDLTAAVDIDDQERTKRRETLFFLSSAEEPGIDKLRIDYVLAYDDDESESKQQKRKIFEDNLRSEGIRIQIDAKESSVDLKTTFVKIHAPIEVIFHNADLMHMRKRIGKEKEQKNNDDDTCVCCSPCLADDSIIPEEEDFFTAPFDKRHTEMFAIDPENVDTFFTSSERGLLVKEVLDRTTYTRVDSNVKKFGISALLNQGVYTAAYPLHEGPLKPPGDEPDPFNKDLKDRDRMRLYEVWARPGRWYSYQPLDLIRKYFGEKIAIYFTWLGFYTAMLIPASIFGVVAFLFGVATLFDNAASEEVCNESGTGNTLMCPQCDQDCPFWLLSKSCLYSRISYVFDNYATVAFACFMAIWATVFLEFWKREQSTLQYEWDCADFELVERMRPEFEFNMKKTKENPITKVQEPYMPWYQQIPRILTSASIILVMMVLVLGAIIGVIIYRIVIVTIFFLINEPEWVGANAALFTTVTAASINFIIIMALNLLYKRVALWLTNLEAHRTYTDFEDSFTYKMFLFQFVNFYGTIFYIAFFKGRFLSYPGSRQFVFFDGYKQDTCDPAGCLIELSIQLFIIMIGKQAINNCKEVLLPAVKNWCSGKGQKDAETETNLYMRWEQDNNLQPLDNLALFEEYLEMVIQYGFVTIFVAAFPLAPLFALVNNVIEIRLDAYKFLSQYQRLPSNRAQDIGAWFSILQGLSFMAVVSNAAIIAWTSEFIPKLVYIHLHSVDGTLSGYVNNSLARFRVGDYPSDLTPSSAINSTLYDEDTLCGYHAYRYAPGEPEEYEYTTQHWQVLCARLAFMLVFEHVCFLTTWLISFLIPDVPARIRALMVYEKQLVRQMTFDVSERERHRDNLEPYQTSCQHCGAAK